MKQQTFSILLDIKHDKKYNRAYIQTTEFYVTSGNDYEVINLSEYDIDCVTNVSIVNTKFPIIQYPNIKYNYNVITKDLRLLWGSVSRNLDLPNNRLKIDFISISHQREKLLGIILDNKDSYK